MTYGKHSISLQQINLDCIEVTRELKKKGILPQLLCGPLSSSICFP